MKKEIDIKDVHSFHTCLLDLLYVWHGLSLGYSDEQDRWGSDMLEGGKKTTNKQMISAKENRYQGRKAKQRNILNNEWGQNFKMVREVFLRFNIWTEPGIWRKGGGVSCAEGAVCANAPKARLSARNMEKFIMVEYVRERDTGWRQCWGKAMVRHVNFILN